MALQGYRRSLILTPIKSAHETSLLFYATFSMPTPIPRQNFGVVPLRVHPWCWGLQRANHEIIFEEFQPVWPRYLNITDRMTDGRTDRRLVGVAAIPHSA